MSQTLVLFVIRTAGNPRRSRPSPALSATILGIVLAAMALPFTPLAGLLGFERLPLSYFAFLALGTVTYLVLVELAKRPLLRPYRARAALCAWPCAPTPRSGLRLERRAWGQGWK